VTATKKVTARRATAAGAEVEVVAREGGRIANGRRATLSTLAFRVEKSTWEDYRWILLKKTLAITLRSPEHCSSLSAKIILFEHWTKVWLALVAGLLNTDKKRT
jgi:hypothetical protein